ncbi:S-methyl thiohydantoin desulfurase domain-containing protein [Micrococcus luteus]|uniref:S-methyl thiohydantoin desulfurase domain-containing protein n=1 Tax=Micrococcus luteus TaxID=1270 RepID=UPI0033CD27A8
MQKLERGHLDALALGFSLLGSGGGGSTYTIELALARSTALPLTVQDVDEVDPGTPCAAVGIIGSTMLLRERLFDESACAQVLAAAERWLGHRVPALCLLEGGGLNGLTPLLFAGERRVIDADLTGRALPSLHQISLFADHVPGLVAACETGAGGVMVTQTDRAIDVERILRTAILQAGGVGCAVFAGFTVGDLCEHSVTGNLSTALRIGRTFERHQREAAPNLAAALGGRVLGEGRVAAIQTDAEDRFAHTVLIDGPTGEVGRMITHTEHVAYLIDGCVEAAAPAIIVALDARTRDVIEVIDIRVGQHVLVLEIPAPAWWTATPARTRLVSPSSYGLNELQV